MNPDTIRAVFLDVDETLINTKSMFAFYEFFAAGTDTPVIDVGSMRATLRDLAAAGAERHTVNRAFYQYLSGQRADVLRTAGRAWFEQELAENGLFHHRTLAEVRRYRTAGAGIYLLSGSFFACLEPIGEYVGATGAFGTEVIIDRGVLTGEIVRPMIGDAKGAMVRMISERDGLDRNEIAAYGDHDSDIPLLAASGHPTVVTTTPDRSPAFATSHGWRVLCESDPTTVQLSDSVTAS